MSEFGDDFGELDEDTEMQNLPLYTERKADGIYRYRRRVPKELVDRLGKGYLYRNLGRTKKDIVGKWSAAHAEIEEILKVAQENAEKVAEISRQKDHRSLILHLVKEEYAFIEYALSAHTLRDIRLCKAANAPEAAEFYDKRGLFKKRY